MGVVPNCPGLHDVSDWEEPASYPGLVLYRYDARSASPNAEDFRCRALEAGGREKRHRWSGSCSTPRRSWRLGHHCQWTCCRISTGAHRHGIEREIGMARVKQVSKPLHCAGHRGVGRRPRWFFRRCRRPCLLTWAAEVGLISMMPMGRFTLARENVTRLGIRQKQPHRRKTRRPASRMDGRGHRPRQQRMKTPETGISELCSRNTHLKNPVSSAPERQAANVARTGRKTGHRCRN